MEKKIKMDDGVARFFTRFEGNLFICWLVLTCVDLWKAQPCLGLPCEGWLKYTDLTDLTLAYIFDHAVCCTSAASSGRILHLITSQLRTKSSLDCPNHVRRTKSSIKIRIIDRWIVRSMFGEQTFAQLRTAFRENINKAPENMFINEYGYDCV